MKDLVSIEMVGSITKNLSPKYHFTNTYITHNIHTMYSAHTHTKVYPSHLTIVQTSEYSIVVYTTIFLLNTTRTLLLNAQEEEESPSF